MGIRSRLKGIVKRAVGMEPASPGSSRPSNTTPAPSKSEKKVGEETGQGNLAAGEDVAWYLKYGDADGWDNTDAVDDVDSE